MGAPTNSNRPATLSRKAKPEYSGLAPLMAIRRKQFMPVNELIWLGLGFRPPKRNALSIDPGHLPTDTECFSVAGLDVVLLFDGYHIKYSVLRLLCGSLYAARPKRLQVIDRDYGKVAYLKLGGTNGYVSQQ